MLILILKQTSLVSRRLTLISYVKKSGFRRGDLNILHRDKYSERGKHIIIVFQNNSWSEVLIFCEEVM